MSKTRLGNLFQLFYGVCANLLIGDDLISGQHSTVYHNLQENLLWTYFDSISIHQYLGAW